ncbi:MAG: tetratricopeptide repeat protein [Rickettsiales bacterium]
MRYVPFLLLALSVGACDLVDDKAKSVDAATLAPLSSREQALLIGADGAAQQGNFVAAEKDYLSAIAASTGHVEAHISLARLYEKQQQPAKEQAILERALALQPDNATVNYMMGKVHMDANRYNAALDSFERGLKQRPNDLDINLGKAVSNDMLAQHSAAQLVYARTMNMNPNANLTSLRTNYAMSMMLSGNPIKAIELLQPEVKKPDVPTVTRHNLALAYGMLGRHAEAKKLLNGEIDEETRTLAIARMKEYLGNRTGVDETTIKPSVAAGVEKPAPKLGEKFVEKMTEKPATKPVEKPATKKPEEPFIPMVTPIPPKNQPIPEPVKPIAAKPVATPSPIVEPAKTAVVKTESVKPEATKAETPKPAALKPAPKSVAKKPVVEPVKPAPVVANQTEPEPVVEEDDEQPPLSDRGTARR